jgi:transposase
MPSSTSSSDFVRTIPKLPWRGITVIVVVMVFAAAAAWELYVRSIGYGPTLNPTEDLWAQRRRAVKPESVVIIGDSRGWFDLDLDELEKGLGKRPVQLAMGGGCAYPVLADLASDERFHGTIICSFTPRLFFAPPGAPPVERSEKAVRRYHTETLAQRASQYLAMPLEENVAFLKQEDLTTEALLKDLHIPDRPNAQVQPRLPPYFGSIDRERRARMIERCARPGELQSRIQRRWLRLFTPPPPPSFIPIEAFMEKMKKAQEDRFIDTIKAVEKLRARGGKIVFVRLPVSGELKSLEDRLSPRPQLWEPLLKRTGVTGIYFEDFPELASFTCPEWSHLSAGDSVEFSKRLVPHLSTALQL